MRLEFVPGVVNIAWLTLTLQALESSLRLDGVITVVDSVNVTKYLANSETSHDVRMQLAFADRILLNKSDLMTPEKVILM